MRTMRNMREEWEKQLDREIAQNKREALELCKLWTNDRDLQRYIVSHLGAFGLGNFDCDWSSWESVELCVSSHEENMYLLANEL